MKARHSPAYELLGTVVGRYGDLEEDLELCAHWADATDETLLMLPLDA